MYPPKEGDLNLCMECGEFLVFGPFLGSLQKCDLTPEQFADKLGLIEYGTLLMIQERIRSEKQIQQILGL